MRNMAARKVGSTKAITGKAAQLQMVQNQMDSDRADRAQAQPYQDLDQQRRRESDGVNEDNGADPDTQVQVRDINTDAVARVGANQEDR